MEEILGDDQTVRGDDQSVGGDDHAPSPKPVDDRKDDDEARVTIPRVQCQHDKDGVCNLHGMGAKRMWKLALTLTRGADGSLVRKKGRVTYYVCDLGRVGRGGKLSQMKISSYFQTGGDRYDTRISKIFLYAYSGARLLMLGDGLELFLMLGY